MRNFKNVLQSGHPVLFFGVGIVSYTALLFAFPLQGGGLSIEMMAGAIVAPIALALYLYFTYRKTKEWNGGFKSILMLALTPVIPLYAASLFLALLTCGPMEKHIQARMTRDVMARFDAIKTSGKQVETAAPMIVAPPQMKK